MSSNCSTALACIDGSNSSKRSLPFAFAQYIAASALRRRSSVGVGSGPDGFPKYAEDPPGAAGGGRFVRVLLEEDDELVATEPGHRVARATRPQDPLGDRHEHLVADLVAQAVVDELEPVEVEQQPREPAPAARDN